MELESMYTVYACMGCIFGYLFYGLTDLVFQLCSYFKKKKKKDE